MDRFDKIQAVLREVLEAADADRPELLGQLCVGDEELRREVDEILAAEGQLPAILGTEDVLHEHREQAIESVETALIEERKHPATFTLPGYRIGRQLGSGGMGVVWEAVQLTPPRSVAIKVIRGGAYVTEQHVRLFQREARALARLRHPSIATIYEAGRTEDGHHFFAMELIRGRDLAAYVKDLPLDGPNARVNLRARLGLFLKIADAIAYSHQRSVVHRDLKPSNILVSPRATIRDSQTDRSDSSSSEVDLKVLDFGLARITDADVAMSTMATEPGRVQGTLRYMSPEQARGDPDQIDLRTDVYSLGVLLFELTTDEIPIDVDARPHESIRRICEEPPRRAGDLRKASRGDLETIIGKALEKEPARRYQSANAMAEDLERHLASLPILARPPSISYQFKKLIVRNRGAFAFATTLLVLLLAFAVTISVMFQQQGVEKRRALLAANKAEAVSGFLHNLLVSATPAETLGRPTTVQDVLATALEELEKSPPDDDEVHGELRRTLGVSLLSLGDYEGALSQLAVALSILETSLGPDAPIVLETAGWLGSAHYEQGELEQAEVLTRRVLDAQKQALGADHPDYAAALRSWGLTRYQQGFPDEATPALREAVRILRSHADTDPADLGGALNHLALIRAGVPEGLAEADILAREALEISRDVFGPLHPEVVMGQHNLSAIILGLGRKDEALILELEAVEMARSIWKEDHPLLAKYIREAGGQLKGVGRYTEAVDMYVEALGMQRRILRVNHPDIASTLNGLGYVHALMGELELAERKYREALAIRRLNFPGAQRNVANTTMILARLLLRIGEGQEAVVLFEESIEMRKTLYGADHAMITAALTGLGVAFTELGRAAEAEEALRKALEIRIAAYGAKHWRTAQTRSALGGSLVALGLHDEAETELLAALSSARELSSGPSEILPETLDRLVALYESHGDQILVEKYRSESEETKIGTSSPVRSVLKK